MSDNLKFFHFKHENNDTLHFLNQFEILEYTGSNTPIFDPY